MLHRQVEDLAYGYSHTTCGFAIQCTGCTQWIDPPVDVPEAMAQWRNNSNAFIEVEQQGTQNEPRIELPEGTFVHGCQASEKDVADMFTWVFILGDVW